jgi:hypothetical protein
MGISNERAIKPRLQAMFAKPYLYVSRLYVSRPHMWFAVAADTYSGTMPPPRLRCGAENLDNVLSFSGDAPMEHGAPRVLPACATRHNH